MWQLSLKKISGCFAQQIDEKQLFMEKNQNTDEKNDVIIPKKLS